MKIKEKSLIINQSITDEMVMDLQKTLKSNKTEKIMIGTKDICAAALQLLLCASKEKKCTIKVDDKILKFFFANIIFS